MIDRSETSPLEELAQLEDAADRGQPGAVAGLGHDAPVLVLDDAAFLETRPMSARASGGSL
jgi:hypothetical protein